MNLEEAWMHVNTKIMYFADAEIIQTNIMSSEVKQQFTNDSTGELKQFDYAVTNSPSLIKY